MQLINCRYYKMFANYFISDRILDNILLRDNALLGESYSLQTSHQRVAVFALPAKDGGGLGYGQDEEKKRPDCRQGHGGNSDQT